MNNNIIVKYNLIYLCLYSTAPPTFVDYGIKTIQNYTYIHHSKTKPNLTATKYSYCTAEFRCKTHQAYSPIPKSAHTSVTDAAKLTSASPTSRKMFFNELARKCYEVASQEEKEAEKPVPVPRRPTTLTVKPQNDLLADDNQGDIPQTSATISGSTYTMTVSSNPGEVTTTTTAAETVDSSSPLYENFNTSGKTMRRRIEQGLPNQAIILFAPIGMAEDLTKVQLILCKEIKTEIQNSKMIQQKCDIE